MKPVFLVAAIVVGSAAVAGESRNQPTTAPRRSGIARARWAKRPSTSPTPTRLSDQQNKGRWVKFEPMSDEFEGKELDRTKWTWAWSGGRAASRPCSATRTSPSRTASCI